MRPLLCAVFVAIFLAPAAAVSSTEAPAPVLVKEFPAHAPLSASPVRASPVRASLVSGSPSPVLVKEFPAHAPAASGPSPMSTGPSPAGSPAPPTQSGPFQLAWSTNFPVAAPLGSFGGGNGSSVHAPDLPSALQSQWGAYPSGWADTATQRGLPVGGYYDPGTTVWISGGQLHIKLWRGASGSVHSAALVPLAAQGRTYGRYVETFRVSQIATGYKSAHLLWPSNGDQDTSSFEVDYPENEWDTGISAYVHAGNDPQQAFPAGADWAGWHTSEIDWTPTGLSFRLDGKLIGSTTRGVPDEPMDWIIQNESALNGESAAPNSSAQMDISYVAYYHYTG